MSLINGLERFGEILNAVGQEFAALEETMLGAKLADRQGELLIGLGLCEGVFVG